MKVGLITFAEAADPNRGDAVGLAIEQAVLQHGARATLGLRLSEQQARTLFANAGNRDARVRAEPKTRDLDRKSRDFALDPKTRDFALDPKTRDFALDPKTRDFALDRKTRDFALDQDLWVVDASSTQDAREVASLLHLARNAHSHAPNAPILVVFGPGSSAADPHKPSLAIAYAALEAGASDTAAAPRIGRSGELEDPGRMVKKLVQLLRHAHQPRGALLQPGKAVPPQVESSTQKPSQSNFADPGSETRETQVLVRRPNDPILVLGASTGGPSAFATILAGVAELTLDCPILLALHLDDEFVVGLAQWLGGCTSRRVVVAQEGTKLEGGTTHLVRSNRQPIVTRDRRIRYVAPEVTALYAPNLDKLFVSLQTLESKGVAALLTGMGQDGAAGLKVLREAGWVTLAQDEKSSVVFGMPKAAVELGAATNVGPLDRLATMAKDGFSKLANLHEQRKRQAARGREP